ncbi:UDP-N-acetylmuramate--L-alanine ligase [Thiomicrospira cyclica]|uniref:UDP-N-acetylmuramate--L-alanine ligase n=1 Tax=Thiomicrospira cyclica (strain DSM 14477 / JCM 11371 / ALM1) TaxID=717773 RepID=F6D9L8_THICA|nr:UDP-N-acetylmuramate--L-alanine ligase [Thiomicrospira cyclica]AEG30975.1 UDP-N-acetylmuramate--L-alanine ligase [Thiomicrospira cyclica ALM1]
MKEQVRHIHFVGIGGVGMAGIAEVCINLGFSVSGSDIRRHATVIRLEALGAKIQLGHQPEWVQQADVVVVSSAIAKDNPEASWAKSSRIPVIPRAEMLAELMRMRYGIAIAGTHGKTTTTSLTAAILTQGGLDPTFVIGGQLNQVGSNARLGSSRYLVAEADESDASFLHLAPMMSVITNIDMDHMETYQGDFSRLIHTYNEFINRLPFYGLTVLCLDDPNLKQMMPDVLRKVRTYGFDADADVVAVNWQSKGLTSEFEVITAGREPFNVLLNIPGQHNVRNALAAIAVALELDVPVTAIQQALATFAGVGRRFEVYPQRMIGGHQVTLVDDYGHHPTELSATIQTARDAFVGKRLVLVFQPHRYSRTRDLFDDFIAALLKADLIILAPVYAAGESPIPGFDTKSMIQNLRIRGAQNVMFAEGFEALSALTEDVLTDDDVVLMMGAGDIGQWAKEWQ